MDIVPADPIVDSSTSDTTPTENTDSLSDHESQFNQPGRVEDGPLNPDADPDEIPTTPANTGQFANKREDARHRASTQRATPEDVAEINKLTKELRELETKVADKDPDAKAAPRLRTLKRQIAALRALDAPPAPEPKPVPRGTPRPQPRQDAASSFDLKKPDINDFASDPDPVAAWTEAMWDWKDAQRDFTRSQQQATEAEQQEHREVADRAIQNLNAFAKERPDFQQVTADFISKRELPAVLLNAIIRSDKQGQFVYHLAQHPELAEELVFLTDGKALTDANVATMQRRLNRELGQVPAAPTRSAVPATPAYTPPPPPNLVRTGPIKSEDELPGDDASLAEHERAYSKRRYR